VFMLALLSPRANARDLSIAIAHTGSNKVRPTVTFLAFFAARDAPVTSKDFATAVPAAFA